MLRFLHARDSCPASSSSTPFLALSARPPATAVYTGADFPRRHGSSIRAHPVATADRRTASPRPEDLWRGVLHDKSTGCVSLATAGRAHLTRAYRSAKFGESETPVGSPQRTGGASHVTIGRFHLTQYRRIPSTQLLNYTKLIHKGVTMKKLIVLSAIAILVSGCSTYSASRYSISTDNVVALRSLNGKTVNIGTFSASTPGQTEIMCRGVGPIKTPDGEPFADFVRKALLDELRIANAYSSSAPVMITGNLDAIDFSSNSGNWNLALTVKSSNGKSMSVSESYKYTSSFYGETACNQTAQAFMPAVQNLVGKVVRSPEFMALVSQ